MPDSTASRRSPTAAFFAVLAFALGTACAPDRSIPVARDDIATRERPATTLPAGGSLPATPPLEPVAAVAALVDRLDLERYKATIKGLTQFGDRLQGTERNRKAVDWIEAQLRSYGCPTERVRYMQPPPAPPTRPPATHPVVPRAVGGGRPRGAHRAAQPTTNPQKQPNPVLRALNAEPSKPGEREQVYCTKVGSTVPNEMYIIGAHMDGRGFGEAANDDGSGTALVMELARILSLADVTIERTIRFALWNSEEGGLNGSRAYVEQRKALQGREDPPGSGRYPEPRWLGMIQHDMMMFDHGAPRADGTVSRTQRPEADINVEFQSTSKLADAAMKLAFFWHGANERYATDYPALVGPHMTNTDSTPFMDLVPAISVRENERGIHIGSGWDPHWHQPTDLYSTFTDADFRLGLNAAQMTLGAVAELAGANVRPTTR